MAGIMKRLTLFSVFVLALISFYCSCGKASNPIVSHPKPEPEISRTLSRNEAEKVFESLNNKCSSLRWKCRIEKNIKISDSDENGSALKTKGDFFEEYTVLYDVKRKRFCVEGNFCLPWYQGKSPTITGQNRLFL